MGCAWCVNWVLPSTAMRENHSACSRKPARKKAGVMRDTGGSGVISERAAWENRKGAAEEIPEGSGVIPAWDLRGEGGRGVYGASRKWGVNAFLRSIATWSPANKAVRGEDSRRKNLAPLGGNYDPSKNTGTGGEQRGIRRDELKLVLVTTFSLTTRRSWTVLARTSISPLLSVGTFSHTTTASFTSNKKTSTTQHIATPKLPTRSHLSY